MVVVAEEEEVAVAVVGPAVLGTGPDMDRGMDPDTGLVAVRTVEVEAVVVAKVEEVEEVEVLMVQVMALALDTVKEVEMMDEAVVAVEEEEVVVVAVAVVVEALAMVVAQDMGPVGVVEKITSPLKLR